jgi:hypothetical protein
VRHIRTALVLVPKAFAFCPFTCACAVQGLGSSKGVVRKALLLRAESEQKSFLMAGAGNQPRGGPRCP